MVARHPVTVEAAGSTPVTLACRTKFDRLYCCMDIVEIKKIMPGAADPRGLFWIERKEEVLPKQMNGMRVLDIGAYNGYYSLLCASRGAKVLSLDVDNQYTNKELYYRYKKLYRLDCEHRELDVYSLDELNEVFDLVIFYDVFYHLDDPMLALRKIFPKVGKTLLLGTYIIGPKFVNVDQNQPLMYFFEPGELRPNDPTNVWGPTTACVEKMLRVVGFSSVKTFNFGSRAIFKASKENITLL